MSKKFTKHEDHLTPLALESYDDPLFSSHALKVNELAEYLQSSTKTIYRMALTGKIPSIRVGKSYRFLLSEVLRSLKTGEIYGKNR